MAADPDPVQIVFDNAIRDFKAGLKNDKLYSEISKPTTIDEVYDATDKLQEEQAKNGHLRHLSKIEPYLEGLRNYASVIEVFMQAKPDVIALLWGPIKLLLQWASTLKQSFDAIISTTADIGVLLPEFGAATKLFTDNDQIKDVLALFFKDILDFYLIALKFFSLPRWKYFFESLWPRHRDKIKVVTNHIERHTLLMRNEVRLEHIQAEHAARIRALEHFERTERSLQRQEYQTIETGISPRRYESKLDWLHGRICEGTGRWLMNDTTFAKWLDPQDTSSKILWLQGIPGAGKTYLSSTVVDKSRTCGHTLFAFLSYNHIGNTSALSIFHSLIFQLASDDDDLQTVLCQSSRENLKSNLNAATGLLTVLLNFAGSTYIVIDGVDEVEEIERIRLLREILELSSACANTKFLISSRPEADLTKILDGNATTIRVDNRNSGSIQAYISRYSHHWLQERNFPLEAEAEIKGLLAPLAWKSKGMFLYAKVVLTSIEYLDLSEIRNEFRALPETLDDAYARVLTRINGLYPPRLKDKARKLVGWIGSCPIPLTIKEIEQAVTISPEDMEGQKPEFANLNIIQICGPIVEVVDDYVQFVHFTVQEYMFSPRISGSISIAEATLSLAVCCITYLSQEHHNQEIYDGEVSSNILSGVYRLHEFATTTWFALTDRLNRHYQSGTVPNELINALETLMIERRNMQYINADDKSSRRELSSFQKQWPELHTMLCRAASFHRMYSEAAYNKNKSSSWINFDPLTISDTSARIFQQMDQLLNLKNRRKEDDHISTILKHYGQRPFKCSFLNCAFRRHGFETYRLRESHVIHHDRPWKCSFPDCEYKDGGFLSRKMRDEHIDKFHQEEVAICVSKMETPDNDELQPLLFDLVQADRVDAVKVFHAQFLSLSSEIQDKLQRLAARSASPPMLDILVQWNVQGEWGWSQLVKLSVEGRNVENFAHLLMKGKADVKTSRVSYASFASEILASGADAIVKEWEKYINLELETPTPRGRQRGHRPAAACLTSASVILNTDGYPDRETYLISLWKSHKILENCSEINLGDVLVSIATTTCSIKLAELVIEFGAKVDFRRSENYLTPLHHAARKTTAEAANLMEFLLLRGADPEARAQRAKLAIRDEKGAMGISKWLGMSWDEVVDKAKEQRTGSKTGSSESSGSSWSSPAPI